MVFKKTFHVCSKNQMTHINTIPWIICPRTES